MAAIPVLSKSGAISYSGILSGYADSGDPLYQISRDRFKNDGLSSVKVRNDNAAIRKCKIIGFGKCSMGHAHDLPDSSDGLEELAASGGIAEFGPLDKHRFNDGDGWAYIEWYDENEVLLTSSSGVGIYVVRQFVEQA